jgi:hypothetical protein
MASWQPKPGDRVWVSSISGSLPGILSSWDDQWPRVNVMQYPARYLSQTFPAYCLRPRTEHVPDLDGEEAGQ